MARVVVHRSEVFAVDICQQTFWKAKCMTMLRTLSSSSFGAAAAAAVVARLFVAMLVEWLECITSVLLQEVVHLNTCVSTKYLKGFKECYTTIF